MIMIMIIKFCAHPAGRRPTTRASGRACPATPWPSTAAGPPGRSGPRCWPAAPAAARATAAARAPGEPRGAGPAAGAIGGWRGRMKERERRRGESGGKGPVCGLCGRGAAFGALFESCGFRDATGSFPSHGATGLKAATRKGCDGQLSGYLVRCSTSS